MRLYILPLLLAAIISLSCDWYILRQIRHKGGRRAYVAGTAALYLMLIVALLMPRRGEGSILPVMWMLYGFLTILIPKVIYVLLSLIGRIPRLWHGRSLHLGMLVGIPAGVIVFGAMWWGALLGRRQIQVNDVTIASERIPAAYDGYRIVQFSDMHVGTWGGDTTFVSEFVDSINALHPDLIVFTGDIVNRRTDELQPFLSV